MVDLILSANFAHTVNVYCGRIIYTFICLIQLYSWVFETVACYVAQVDLELTVAYAVLRIMAILLPQPSE